MGILNDIEKYFHVKDLYEVFGIKRDANESAIKKAYHNLSLKHHPDKFQNESTAVIENQTAKFQLLAKIHKVLSDNEKRELYDEQGIILDDESMDNADWIKYWRLIFPKITEKDIADYMKKYTGSEEEIADLKKVYIDSKGDMNLINECMIGFEEERTRKMLNELIESGELDALPKFVNESQSSINKRKRKIAKEKKEFDADNENRDDDLVKALAQNMARRQGGFDAMIANMEAKYGNAKKKQKNKRN